MTASTWNRGDGQPDHRRLDEALDRVLEHCRPVEVILFGSAARGELQETSDIDLLVVLADGDPADPRRLGVDICQAIGYDPRADVTLAFEENVRRGARRLASVLRVACEEGVVLYRRGQRHAYAPRARAPARAERCVDRAAIRGEADWLWEHAREALGLAIRRLAAEWLRSGRLAAACPVSVRPKRPLTVGAGSRHLYAGCRPVKLQAPTRLVPG